MNHRSYPGSLIQFSLQSRGAPIGFLSIDVTEYGPAFSTALINASSEVDSSADSNAFCSSYDTSTFFTPLTLDRDLFTARGQRGHDIPSIFISTFCLEALKEAAYTAETSSKEIIIISSFFLKTFSFPHEGKYFVPCYQMLFILHSNFNL